MISIFFLRNIFFDEKSNFEKYFSENSPENEGAIAITVLQRAWGKTENLLYRPGECPNRAETFTNRSEIKFVIFLVVLYFF